MSYITLSVFSTVPSANEWRDAVASGLMTSFVEVWLTAIEQSRLVQLNWVSSISWCWRDSDLIERICMCTAQHCLNWDFELLKRWHFPVPSCVILSNILHPCHLYRKSLSSWRDCLSRVDAESWNLNESSTISFKKDNPRSLNAPWCSARHSTRHSVRCDLWRYQLTATKKTFEYTFC